MSLINQVLAKWLAPTFGGWGVLRTPRYKNPEEVVAGISGFDLFIGNPNIVDGEWDGRWKYYVVDSSDDPHGAPRIIQEPSLSITAPDGSGQIVGAIVIGADSNVVLDENDKPKCFSWSNLVFNQGKEFDIDPDGDLVIDDQIQGRLALLLAPDKNRLYGNDGKPALVGIFLDGVDVNNLSRSRLHAMETVARELAVNILLEA